MSTKKNGQHQKKLLLTFYSNWFILTATKYSNEGVEAQKCGKSTCWFLTWLVLNIETHVSHYCYTCSLFLYPSVAISILGFFVLKIH